jgi:NAD(P)-dependent dehydrogenase (short-subunit alcohol dehydrogenase family)
MVDFSLKDRVALITGASRGIGEAVALALAASGARCILVGRKLDPLTGVVAKITAAGGKAEALACHVGELEQLKILFQHIRDKYGKLNIVVNNAATNPYFGEMLNAEEWAWDKTNDVNLKGPFFITQFAARLMIETGSQGAIVNVASVNAVRPAPMQGIYSITKAGVVGMTKAFAKELAAKNIRVNALLPGLTDTKFSEAIIANKAILDYAVGGIPMGRIAQPEEMAGAVLYLVSDASSFTTGSCITCDGGMLA